MKTSKFNPRRDGPSLITKVFSPTSYGIATMTVPNVILGKYHVSARSPYCGPDLKDTNPTVPIRKRGRPKKAGV